MYFVGDFEIINNELESYSKKLVKAPQIVVLNKTDLLFEDFTKLEEFKEKFLLNKINIKEIPGYSVYYQPLFDLMDKEHGKILTISEMDEIIETALKVKKIINFYIKLIFLIKALRSQINISIFFVKNNILWACSSVD